MAWTEDNERLSFHTGLQNFCVCDGLRDRKRFFLNFSIIVGFTFWAPFPLVYLGHPTHGQNMVVSSLRFLPY